MCSFELLNSSPLPHLTEKNKEKSRTCNITNKLLHTYMNYVKKKTQIKYLL